MTRDEFIADIEQTYKEGVELIKIKNRDYGVDANPFRNFEMAAMVGVSPDRAIFLRVLDKFARLSNILDKPATVSDETVKDTLLDCINYLAILKAYLDDKQR